MTITVEAVHRKVQYTSTGSLGPYAFAFKILASADIKVSVGATVKTLTTHYTTTYNADGTGSVTFTSGNAPASDALVTIESNQSIARTTDYSTGGDFTAASINDALDKLTINDQQIETELSRNIQLAGTTKRTTSGTGTSGSLFWPYDDTPSNNANKCVVYDGDGTALIIGPSTTDISSASTNATNASNSATAAASSASTASTHATTSTNFATKVDAAISSGVYSSKEYAQGTQASTGGSAKSWAQDTDQVDGASTNDRSAKNWAQGASMTGSTLGGSAKDWAQLAEDSQVNGSEYSAKHYAAKASASATTASAFNKKWTAVTTLTTGTHNLERADVGKYYVLNASGGTITINLPPIGSGTSDALDGHMFGFEVGNVDNAISIVRDGDTINGASANYSGLTAVGQVIHFIADDATSDNWYATIMSQSPDASATVKGLVELATDGETATGSDSARVVTPANVASAYVAQGLHTIWVPASAMYPCSTNGCADLEQVETTAQQPEFKVLDFDKDSDEFAQFTVAFPKSWNAGTITYRAYWVGVAWTLAGRSVADNAEAIGAFGTAVVVQDDSQGDATEVLVSPISSAVTIASAADDALTFFQVSRDVSDGNDDMAGDARLVGIQILYTVDSKDDS